MAKPGAKDEPAGMDKVELKRHLKLARNEPIPIAFALGGDGKAILEMDRRKPGRALEKKLKEAAPDSKNHRWGMASVDPENEKMIVFTINKPSGGMARKLTVALKGTGFSKVRLVLEDGTEVEAHEDADAEEGDDGDDGDDEKAPAAPPADDILADRTPAQAQAAAPAAAETSQAAAQAAPPSPPPAAADAASLAKDLTGLVKRMLVVIAKDPAQKAALTEMATDAQASIKRGDVAQAGAGIDILREALGDVETSQASGQGGGAPNGAAASPAANGRAAVPAAANGQAKPSPLPSPVPAANGQAAADDPAKELILALTQAFKKVLPMVESFPGLGEVVKTTALAVREHIKAGRHDQARAGIQQILQSGQGLEMPVREAGAEAAGQGAGATGAGAAAKVAKSPHQMRSEKHAPAIDLSSKVWEATRAKVHSEVGALHDEIEGVLKGHSMVDEISQKMRKKVSEALHYLDDGLTHSLAAINKAADAAERERHVEAARDHVNQLQDHVTSHKVFEMLDRNPFKKLSLTKLVSASLQAIHQSIR